MKTENHPCFNPGACKSFGRIHLPVAPRCNVQCNFCDRKFDCVGESRPGVCSAVLSPRQAISWLDRMTLEKPGLAVAGIAGPGDPFANPEETLVTLGLVREKYPEMLLCVATNGLDISPCLDDLARLRVTHVSVTVNAVDPEIGARIYAWVRHAGRARRPGEGAEILLARQREAVQGLKSREILVKINAIVLPGINEDHIETVAKTTAAWGADLFNCMAYCPNPGSAFRDLPEPSAETMARIRDRAGRYLPRMDHCTRCRADAAGLLGEVPDAHAHRILKECSRLPSLPEDDRPYVAVASREGVLVNQHLGEAKLLMIFGRNGGAPSLVETRSAPEAGSGDDRWHTLAGLLGDCRAILVSAAGENPKRVLSGKGIRVLETDGLIEDAVEAVFEGRRPAPVRNASACGAGCRGSGNGCM